MGGGENGRFAEHVPPSVPPHFEEWLRQLSDCGRVLSQAGERLVALVEEMAQGAPAQTAWIAHGAENGGRPYLNGHTDPRRPHLTASEHASLALWARGLSYAQIAHERGVSAATIGEQLKNARGKLDATSTAEAVAKARELGLIE